MARPTKQRCVGSLPTVRIFKPYGIPAGSLGLLTLTVDELEALRLADLEGDEHEAAAAKMNISRPTFGRILERARRTTADALLHGKALRIEGGPVTVTRRGRVRCTRCNREWEVPVQSRSAFRCPRCPERRRS
jgi:predicted DNA-binding protein (UPF0251 family)